MRRAVLFACACVRAVKVVFIFALLFVDTLMLMWFACTDADDDDHDHDRRRRQCRLNSVGTTAVLRTLSGTPRLSRYTVARVGVCLVFDGADFYTHDVDDVKSDLLGGANYVLLLTWVPCRR